MKHSGTLEELLAIIEQCSFTVSKVKEQQNGYQIRTDEGAIVNWYVSTNTVQIQGKKAVKERLTEMWELHAGNEAHVTEQTSEEVLSSKYPNSAKVNEKIFVVHGHDATARDQLELVLHKLELEPFVLANTGGGGLTIIEALEAEIGTANNQARFGIVLMTPDDMGYEKSQGHENVQPRARQNVVLEMGMLISAIGRTNVAILKKGHVEVPSDAQGILYIPFNDHVKETVPKLVDRLQNAGFVLAPQAITKASS